MRRLIRRLVLWAVPELRTTVEREQWYAAFWAAVSQQQHTYTAADAPDADRKRPEVN